MIPAWNHGSIGWSCSTASPTPLSAFSSRRLESVLQSGAHEGKTAVYAPCPLCEAEGRLTWIRIEIKEQQ